MEEEKTKIQLLRADIAASCPTLSEWKIVEICQDYGIPYDVPDVNTYRIFALLASAERKLLE